ncbi:MAG: DUF4190 domain-containing protein [Bacteroidales bacterium]|nr:DUF4190 domain-containing protein [Bacteroidales bacterium]
METNTNFSFENNFNQPQVPLPNATVILVLGILSIIGCCCYGLPGLVCGIIALVLSKSAKEQYIQNPSLYTQSSYSNMNAGKICAIIGLILSVLFLVYVIGMILFVGIDALSDPVLLQERLQELIPR